MLEIAVRLGRLLPEKTPGYIANRLESLQFLARSLHRAAERSCNGFYEEAQEKRHERRVRRMEEKAWGLARELESGVYFQTDPRGCPLYFFPDICHGISMAEFQHRRHADYNHDGIAIAAR